MHNPLAPLAPTRLTILNNFHDGMEVIPDRRSDLPDKPRIQICVMIFILDNKHNTAISKMIPANIYLLKVNNRNTRTRREVCSKLKIKTPDDVTVFLVNFEHVSHPFLVFLLLTLSR